jgi:predicted TPR repeat methyltransferase
MPFGSIFHTFDRVLLTGDITHLSFKNNYLTRLGFKFLGIPHIGLRLRARKINKHIPLRVTRMLDAGFGTGVYSFTLANKVKNIKAVDINTEKVEYVKQVNPFDNLTFQIMDLTNLTYADSRFDLIICSDVLEFIKNDEAAFSELARVLNSSGTLLMTVPYDSDKNRKWYKDSGHERPGYTKRDIEDLCIKNNLRIVNSEGYLYDVAEKLFETNFNINNKVLLCLSFYPLYFVALISEYLASGSSNGIFFKIIKK